MFISWCVYGFIKKTAEERGSQKAKAESVRREQKVKYRAKSFKKREVLCRRFLSPHRKMRREMSDSVVYGWGGWWKTAERLSIQRGIRVWPDRGGLPANFLNSANGKEKNFIWNTSSPLSVFLPLSCPVPSISPCLSNWSLGFSMQIDGYRYVSLRSLNGYHTLAHYSVDNIYTCGLVSAVSLLVISV